MAKLEIKLDQTKYTTTRTSRPTKEPPRLDRASTGSMLRAKLNKSTVRDKKNHRQAEQRQRLQPISIIICGNTTDQAAQRQGWEQG